MSRLAIIGIGIVAVFVLIAVFAPWIAAQDVGATNLSVRYMAPSAAHWFGTDTTGRDIFSRVVFGARISLEVFPAIASMCSWRFRDCCWRLPWWRFWVRG